MIPATRWPAPPRTHAPRHTVAVDRTRFVSTGTLDTAHAMTLAGVAALLLLAFGGAL